MNILRHYLLALQFLTRIPMCGPLKNWAGFDPNTLDDCTGHFPGVGWLVGVLGAILLLLVVALLPISPWSTLIAAVLSTAFTIWITGAFHEDGLADTSDALGGLASPERALEIMKDSRIGSYGTVALVLALLLKCALLALLMQAGPWRAAAALVVAHALSRLAPLLIMRGLTYVTPADTAKSKPIAEHVSGASLRTGLYWSIPALVVILLAWGVLSLLLAALFWALVLAACWRLWRRRLGGFTGDTLGATQQLCELALYLGMAASL